MKPTFCFSSNIVWWVFRECIYLVTMEAVLGGGGGFGMKGWMDGSVNIYMVKEKELNWKEKRLEAREKDGNKER